ncbi:MAG: hypothetical protein NTY02_15590 [Acidobacteria bacterium]|nr:hypothetical protein [Acidobacteriota bacterium]
MPGADDFAGLQTLGDLEGAMAYQAGRPAGMNFVAQAITGFAATE